VVITNGEHRASLSIVRSLGKKGLNINVAGSHKNSPAFFSKYTNCHMIYCKQHDDLVPITLLKYVKKVRPKVLMPILDDALMSVYKHKVEFEKYTRLIPMPTYSEFRSLSTKETLNDFAKDNNLNTPWTYVVDIDMPVGFANKLKFPLIIKPNIGAGSKGVYLVNNREDMVNKIKQLKKLVNTTILDTKRIIIQEYIPNKLSYFNALIHEGKLIARQHIRILETYPSVCGGPARSISIYDRRLEAAGRKVVNKLKLSNGVLNIQFIFDKRSQQFRLLEINPRLWGSIQSSIDSGMDFPYLLYQIAIGKDVRKINAYCLHKKVKHFCSEFKSCCQNREIKNFIELVNLGNCKTEFQLTDLRPNFVELMNDSYNLFTERKKS